MKKEITLFIDNTYGRYFALLKDAFIQLNENTSSNFPKFYSQHNNDKYWDKRACGIACVQMILDNHNKNISLKRLIEIGLEHDGYDTTNDIGWYHHSLVKVLQDFDIKAKVKKYVSSNEIAKLISKNYFVIASVESKMGGHLILIYDYELNKSNKLKYLIYHDPWYLEGGAKSRISKPDFDKISKRRIIYAEK
jgi:ABC-type bacteriocin/lantibiotic exporter with double-glycine peptidase domain